MADFNKWTQAHRDWRIRLSDYVGGTSKEKLDALTVGRDDQCELGKWIQSMRGQMAGNANFLKLLTAHAEFHRQAAEIVKLADAGKKDEAQRLLSPTGAYFHASNEVIKALQTCQEKKAA